MHYTRMINPLALLSCDSPASAKIIVDYLPVWGMRNV